MPKLIDVGQGKSRQEAKALRMKAYKRPKLKKDIDALRDERIASVRGAK